MECRLSSMQLIDEIHKEFVNRIKGIFDQHKAAYGWADKELEIH